MLTKEMTDAQYREHCEVKEWIERVQDSGRDIIKGKHFISARKLIEEIGNEAYLDMVKKLSEEDLNAFLWCYNSNDPHVKAVVSSHDYMSTSTLINYIQQFKDLYPYPIAYPKLTEDTKLINRIGEYGFERMVEFFTPEQLKLFVWLYNEGYEDAEDVVAHWTPGNLISEACELRTRETPIEDRLITMIIKLNHFDVTVEEATIPTTWNASVNKAAYCIRSLGGRLYNILLGDYQHMAVYGMLEAAIDGDRVSQERIFAFANKEEQETLRQLFKWDVAFMDTRHPDRNTDAYLEAMKNYCIDTIGVSLFNELKHQLGLHATYNTVKEANDGSKAAQSLLLHYAQGANKEMLMINFSKKPEELQQLQVEQNLSRERAEAKYAEDHAYCAQILGQQKTDEMLNKFTMDAMVEMVNGFINGDEELSDKLMDGVQDPVLEMQLYHCAEGQLTHLSEHNPFDWSYQQMMESLIRFGKDRTLYLMEMGNHLDMMRIVYYKYTSKGKEPSRFKIMPNDFAQYGTTGECPPGMSLDDRVKAFTKELQDFVDSSKIKLAEVVTGDEIKEIDPELTSNTDNAFSLARAYGVTNLDDSHEFEFMNRMHAFRSNISFERMAQVFQEMEERQVPMAMVVYLYHWSETPLTMAELTDRHIFASDNSRDWNTICHPNMHLYQLTCVITRPLFCIEQWDSGEMIMWGSPTSRRKLDKRNIDSIVVTPHRWSDEPELREIKIMNAKKSVLEIVELGITPARSKEMAKAKKGFFEVGNNLVSVKPECAPMAYLPTNISYF